MLVDTIEHLRAVVAKLELAVNTMQVQSNKSKCGKIFMGPQHLVVEARRRLETHPMKVE